MKKNINKKENKSESGFTLIEILVVIGMIALLAAVVIVAINPARQFAQGRNSQRVSNVNAILNAIGQRMADNKGIFTCASDQISTSTEETIASDGVNLRSCLVPVYISELPVDPVDGKTCADADCLEGYGTEYTVIQDDANGRITVCAPNAADETAIASSTEICVTR